MAEKHGLVETLFGGDPRVRALLGKQKLPADGRIRRSRFVYSMYIDAHYLLFHTMTKQILLADPEVIGWMIGQQTFSADALADETANFLYTHFFLVPETEDECRTYLELKDVLILKEELPQAITHYVILPTTTCNARCFYCFEQGMRYHKMTQETVNDTVRFILEHKPENGAIHIHWFGGEPTCAPENIDGICRQLTEAGVTYTAEMTSNGSLLDEHLSRHAADFWKIKKVQITLDGLAEEYAARKRYTHAIQAPFETVISNIHHMIAAGIRVAVRLNADEQNIGELFRLADYLLQEFSEEERKQMTVYAHSLFGQSGDGLDICPVGAGSDELETAVLHLNEYLIRRSLTTKDLSSLMSLKSHYCMVTAPECNALIDAEGRLFACDAMPESMRYGDVHNGLDPELWKQVSKPCEPEARCRTCAFLPNCTEFSRCPNRMAFDACQRQEKRVLESDLRFLYHVHLERKAEAEAEKARENAPGSEPEQTSESGAEHVQH